MKEYIVLMACLALLVPMAFAVNVGSGVGVDIETENFIPLIWMCDMDRYLIIMPMLESLLNQIGLFIMMIK